MSLLACRCLWLAAALVFPILLGSPLALAVQFETQKIKIGGQILTVEIADTNERRQQGLMHRKSLPEGRGMLFVFDGEDVRGFWMKNTLIQLSIGFFDSKRSLVDIQDMYPASPIEKHPKVHESRKPAKYALEVPLGWFDKHKVRLNTKFEFINEN